ncbi:MAG: GAF domain-containing protein [Burkholderiaceae bacterium]
MFRRDSTAELHAAQAAPGLAAHGGILAEITAGVAAGDDVNEVLQRFLAPLMRLAGAQAGSVRVLAADGSRLLLVGTIGQPQVIGCAKREVLAGCGVCGAALNRGDLVWAQDLAPCAQDHADAVLAFDCRRALAVPLRHRERVLGLYSLFFAGPASLGDELAALLKAVGELLGLALHNARLEQDRLRATVLAERQAMAAEVHDAVAQTLAFVKMRLPLLQQAIADGDAGGAARYCADVRSAVSAAHTNLREVLTHLQAPMDPLGLKHALQMAVLSFQQLTQIELDFADGVPALALAPAQEFQVYRVVQEALANIAKHANASRVWLTIEQRDDCLAVRIEDDGAGMAPAHDGEDASHLGLGIMRQRAAQLGGALAVSSRPGGGTCVELSLAYPAPGAAQRHGAEEVAR